MASARKEAAAAAATTAAAATPPAQRSAEAAEARGRLVPHSQTRGTMSRLPPAFRLPLVIVLSLSWTVLGYSFLDKLSGGGDLATFATAGEDGWTHAAVLVGWQALELALSWFADYDSYDVAALSLLSHGPTLYLLYAFYQVQPWLALARLSIGVLSSLVPFMLVRPLSAAHSAAPAVPNRVVLEDRPIRVYTTILASAVYAVTIWSSYRTFLRMTLLLSFDGIPSIEPTHSLLAAPSTATAGSVFTEANLLVICLALLFGSAARSFIFTPATATGRTIEDAELARFDPVAATLGETLRYNVWGFSTQIKVFIVRTLVVMLTTGLRTYLQCARTIKGVESAGAATYALAWVGAALFAGTSLGLVVE